MIQAWRRAVPLIPGVLQVACCAQRVPRARVCPLNALTHAYARTRAAPAERRARARCPPRPCLTHTTPILRHRNRLSGHCGALRVVHVEISRARRRNNFKSRPSRTARSPVLTRTCLSARPAHTCIRHRSNVEDKWVVLYGRYIDANYNRDVWYTVSLRGILQLMSTIG